MSEGQSFAPCNSVHVLTTDSLIEVPSAEVTADLIGQKAYGLACIPSEWFPQFCVINHSAALKISTGSDILSLLNTLPWFVKTDGKSALMIRSSAVNETIEERGQLISEQASLSTLAKTISKCVDETRSREQTIHWILQPRIVSRSIGHLSNERRVSKVKRDWIIEFEAVEGENEVREPVNFGIRKWRDGKANDPSTMECSSAIAIDRALREPARWATDKLLRVHYEWVWDGSNIWIVQADLCTERIGAKPESFLPKTISQVEAASLNHFRLAKSEDLDTYRKLANTKLYAEIGYEPPQFYILDDRSIIKELIEGNPSQTVLDDIASLVSQQPLVIRSDGIQQQMLPRSDGLNSVNAVVSWFKDDLPEKLESKEEWESKLVFVCHHFLPALSSAWSMAEPGKRVVRVEALWGLPEGMYWFSHDAFEIDTGDVDLQNAVLNTNKFKYSQRLRCKEWFVAPDPNGVWSNQRTSEPYDWKATISNNEWLVEIAITTRRIAERLGHPVNVMWFLGIHKSASKHTILPWYHEKSELDRSSLRVAPRFKTPNSRSIEIHKFSDLEGLLTSPTPFRQSIKRISVSPREPDLIRNDDFVDQLAEFAREQNAVIELKGGILSHVFYMLQKKGCVVEIVDPFGATEESLVFKKVVRDKIPESISEKGEIVTHLKIKGDQLVKALKSKLLEEALEVMDAKSTEDTIEELADVLEVIHALTHHLKVSMKSVDEARKQKRNKRGGFDEGIVLVKTTTPASLSLDELSEDQIQDRFEDMVILEAGAASLEHEVKLHQDEPEIQGQKQRLLEIEFPAAPDVPISKKTDFKVKANLDQGIVEIPLSGEWSISRKNSEIKVRFLITTAPIQTEFAF